MSAFFVFIRFTIVYIFCFFIPIVFKTYFVHAEESFALIELYTSEGCSSCPPADLVLREITMQSKEKEMPVYTLGFHVDYWNYLGWKDPFSDKEFSIRQRNYALQWKKENVYTPQMIINGRVEFNGFRADLAEKYIKEMLEMQSVIKVDISDVKVENDYLKAEITLSDNPKNSVLHIAVVENINNHIVQRGENSGLTLNHAHTVRIFKTINIKKNNYSVKIKSHEDINYKESAIIAYVQDHESLIILGANQYFLK